VLEAMLEKDAAKRLQTADEVVRRLKPWAGEAVTTTPEDNSHAAPAAAATTRPQIPDPTGDTKSGFFDDLITGDDDSAGGNGHVAVDRSHHERPRVSKSASEPASRHAVLLALAFTPLVLASVALLTAVVLRAF
jgi:hypothetical protein